jgi:hypothetical protein
MYSVMIKRITDQCWWRWCRHYIKNLRCKFLAGTARVAGVARVPATFLLLLLAGLVTGCVGDPLTETVVVDDVQAGDIESSSLTTSELAAENATLQTLILGSLPSEDPGIPGMVWSDNGTLRISK